MAKAAADVFDADPSVEGLVLVKHGIFGFGVDARQAYERMIALVTMAEQRLAKNRKPVRKLCRHFAMCMERTWSGWGIRTLSSDHPSFNPYNYQTGAVWPHDNSLIALGMRRYGFAAEAAAVARDISGAASHFLLSQLPELYAGLQR